MPATLHAKDYHAEDDFFGDSPVVLTVSRMHKPLADAPASVTVIDRQMIRNSGARQVADIFRMVPGFVVGYQDGNTPVVTYHGLGQRWHRQLQVLIDGRSVFIPSFGGVPWSNLPLLLEDIERVEVTRGPNAVTYGANAFLATINIITRHAAEDVGGKLIATGDVAGDPYVSDIYFRFGSQHENFDWRISAGREKDDGYADVNDSKLLEKLNFRSEFITAGNQFWTLQAGINNSSLGRGVGDELDQFRDEDTTNSYQNIKWELIQDKVSTSLLFTHTRQDVEDSFQAQLNDFFADELGITITDPFYFDIDYARLSERTDLEIFQNRELNAQTQLVYGASVRKDKVKSFYLFNDETYHDVDTERLFSSMEWKSGADLSVDLGLMLEDTNYTDQEASYRLSLIQKIGHHNLRLVTSSAKRNPILWEIIGNTQFSTVIPAIPLAPPPFDTPTPFTLIHTLTDGNAMPETIESIEIGLFSEHLDRQLTTDIKLFSYRITDQIDITQDTIEDNPIPGFDQEFFIAVNQDETRVEGIEFAFNFSPHNKHYRIYGGASLPRAESFKDKYEDSFAEYSAYVAGHVDFHRDHQLSASYYLVDEISWWDFPREQIDNYQKLDLRYQYSIDSKNDIKLELIGYNLIEDFAEYFEQRLQEKSMLLRISGRF